MTLRMPRLNGSGTLAGQTFGAVAAGGAAVVDVRRIAASAYRPAVVGPVGARTRVGRVTTRMRGLRSRRRVLISMPQVGGHSLGK